MKVQLCQTFTISDEHRAQMAVVIDGGPTPRRKQRIADREEIKEFVWTHGKQWRETLSGLYAAFTASEDVEGTEHPDYPGEGADDLLGGGDQDESDPLLSELEADLLGGSDDEADEDIL